MSLQTLASIPLSFTAGDTLLFTESFADYPPATWTAILRITADASYTVTATTSGTLHLFTLAKAYSATIPTGRWPYSITVDDGTQRATAKTGTIVVLPNPAATHEKTIAEKLLEALESAMLVLNADPYASVDFNGQAYTSKDLNALDKMRTGLQAEVISEQRELAAWRGSPDQGAVSVRYK